MDWFNWKSKFCYANFPTSYMLSKLFLVNLKEFMSKVAIIETKYLLIFSHLLVTMSLVYAGKVWLLPAINKLRKINSYCVTAYASCKLLTQKGKNF